MISQRPAEVEDRAVPGHWEGDLLMGKRQTAIGTLVERRSRYVMLFPLPDGNTAEAVRAALGEIVRVSHQGFRDQLSRPWVATARTKGLRDRTALPLPGTLAFHVVRQGMVDILPRLATRAPLVLGMSLLVEKVFVLEGLGDMLIDGLATRDESRVLIVLVLAVVLVQACALATRLGHTLLDPLAGREAALP